MNRKVLWILSTCLLFVGGGYFYFYNMFLIKANDALRRSEFIVAKESFSKAKVMNPFNDKLDFKIAEMSLMAKDYKDAEGRFIALKQKNLLLAPVSNYLAQIYFYKNDLQRAMLEILLSIDIDSSDAMSWILKARIERRQKQYSAAEDSVLRALKESDKERSFEFLAYRELTPIYSHQGYFEKAVKILDSLEEKYPGYSLILFERAKAYEYLKDRKNAEKAWRQFIRSHRGSGDVADHERYDAYANFRLEEIEKGNFLDPASSAQIWGQI